MKFPLNWLDEIVKIPKDIKNLTDNLTMIGHLLDKQSLASQGPGKKDVVDGETIVDLELRGNRADCYSILGIAREIGAIYGIKTKPLQTAKLIRANKLERISLNIKTPLVRRAMITKILNVKIIPSPKWLSQKLKLYGMESVNNMVDLTNYVMIETGEPMHAFDLDKIGENLEIRPAKDREKITTFQGSTLTLTKEDLVWAKDNYVLSVAGAIGEKHNSISNSTKNILLEAANYDRANIRKSVYKHNLLTEAGIRHEKDLDPNMVEGAIARFIYFIKKYDWGESDHLVYDYYPNKISPWKLTLSLKQLADLGGIEISKKEIVKILKNLNFRILSLSKNDINVEIPTYRTDVTIDEDLIEEVLRIYGYENIPAHVLSLEIPKQITPDFIIQENSLRQNGGAVGFNEAITSSFVKEDLGSLNKHAMVAEASVISLMNPPSQDVKNMRETLLPNLYELTKKAVYQGADESRLFEIGKIYYKEKGKYLEKRKIGFTYFGKSEKSFLTFKSLLISFFVKSEMDIPSFNLEATLTPLSETFELSYGKKVVGYGGVIDEIHFAEIDLDSILDLSKKYQTLLWPKYPPQIEDITFDLPEKTKIGNVAEAITSMKSNRSERRIIEKVELKDIYKNSYTFRIWYQDAEKTLTDAEVAKIRDEIIKEIKNKFGGTVKD